MIFCSIKNHIMVLILQTINACGILLELIIISLYHYDYIKYKYYSSSTPMFTSLR